MKSNHKPKAFLVWSVILSVLFVFLLVITLVLTQNGFLYNTINSVLGGERRVLKSGDPSEYEYFSADPEYKNKSDVLAAANALNEQICEEGAVLLKNKNGALPLAEGQRITVFGKNSVNLVLGGSGSSAGTGATADVDLYSSLQSAGFQYNPVMKSFYESSASGGGRAATPGMGTVLTGFPVGETPMTDYPSDVTASYASDYNDVALVVLSRIGGEGYDLPRTMFWNGSKYNDWTGTEPVPGARSRDDHYLQLDANEENMLKEACGGAFRKVVVVVNCPASMELGFLKENSGYNALKGYGIDAEKIDAALWIGNPGTSGIRALGKILSGEVNPSGRTTDTYALDFRNDPTWENFGNNLTADGNRYLYQGNGTNAYFVEYREGIYSGYRYYETRGYTETLAGNAGWYDENVVFPMGYGLSYADFEWNVKNVFPADGSVLSPDDEIEITVEVANTDAARSGKDVVQLYYTSPYLTENGGKGIEKSHVMLGDFAKTEEIAAGDTAEVTLRLRVRDMASYDYSDANGNGFAGYELEGGEYTLRLSENAHTPVETITYTVPDGGFAYETTEDGKPIGNLFDDVSGHIGEYLSRKDNFANYDALKGASDAAYRAIDLEFANAMTYRLDDQPTDPWYAAERPVQSERELSREETEVRLYDLIGKKYNDPLWDRLLDQLTVEQMSALIGTGNFRTVQIECIDKPLTVDADGPMGFAIFMGEDTIYDTCYYASECVLGSTWNASLAYELGRMVGNEGVIGNEKGDGRSYSGWYAPAMNLHRNQFGGRNFEYYGEDGYLSGTMAANVVRGAKTKGVYTYAKHFALNEQETNRDTTGLVTWANEQSMRELYFRPFEICVKEGGTTAMMSSFNRIGLTWAGGDYNLLTGLLREEWGFEGMVITDFNLIAYMDADQMIRAGGDLNLSPKKSPTSTTTDTDVAMLRRATKNILYTVAGSNAMNGYGPNVVWGYAMPWWVIWLIVADCAAFLLAAALAAAFVLRRRRIGKGSPDDEDEEET